MEYSPRLRRTGYVRLSQSEVKEDLKDLKRSRCLTPQAHRENNTDQLKKLLQKSPKEAGFVQAWSYSGSGNRRISSNLTTAGHGLGAHHPHPEPGANPSEEGCSAITETRRNHRQINGAGLEVEPATATIDAKHHLCSPSHTPTPPPTSTISEQQNTMFTSGLGNRTTAAPSAVHLSSRQPLLASFLLSCAHD